MAVIKPFRALRPKPEWAAQICELPYDVMSSAEARALAKGNPRSFLHVSKSEIDWPDDIDPYDPRVYAKAKENFDRMIQEGALIQDEQPAYYLYRQIMGGHRQTGLVAVASCADYLSNVIKKHELTRPAKEDDRARHIEALDSQTGPVFLTYRSHPTMNALLDQKTMNAPDIDFTAKDGVRHASWAIRDIETINAIEDEFRVIPSLYVADGHHRSAAAARVFQKRQGASGSAYFLTVTFPHDQLQIRPYNRALRDLNGLTPQQLLERLAEVFEIQPDGSSTPSRQHEVCLFLGGRWHSLTFRARFIRAEDLIGNLDVTLLQKHVLEPILGIDDPRTSERVQFIGGIRGSQELEKLVSSGDFSCAFSMFPTSISDLMSIADVGGIMPPKSTWFEPKLRDAMFCHLI